MTRAAPFVCLDDSLSGRTLLFERPVEILSAWTPSEAWQALDRMEKLRQSGLELAGYFAYELGYLFEPRLAPLLPDNRQVPLIRFGAFETARAGDLPVALPAGGEERALVNRLVPSWSLPAYALRFERVRDYIAAGDVYQINLTFPLDGVLDGDPLELYRVLRKRQPVAHGGVVALGPETVLSLSPELFFELEGRVVRSRPMKGTARRGLGPHEDMMIARDLKEDEKQRAENLMIVDLLRNDIGRLSRIGTVRVPQLFTVETYNTLHQMTSTVEGELAGALSIGEILRRPVPLRFGDRGSQDPGDGDHSRARDGAARGLLRCHRPHRARTAACGSTWRSGR